MCFNLNYGTAWLPLILIDSAFHCLWKVEDIVWILLFGELCKELKYIFQALGIEIVW